MTECNEIEDGMDWQIPQFDDDDGPTNTTPKVVDWDSPSIQRFLASFTGLDTYVRPTVRKPRSAQRPIPTKFTESFVS